MHYKNGRAARVGDTVMTRVYGRPLLGVVVEQFPGQTSCNLVLMPWNPTTHTVNAHDCLHANDAFIEGASAKGLADNIVEHLDRLTQPGDTPVPREERVELVADIISSTINKPHTGDR